MEKVAAHILVVDDEESILEFITYSLRRQGYTVTTATRGDEALALFKQNRFDLAVLDIMLPGMDGYHLCREIRATSAIPIIFLSAKDTEVDKVVGLEIGADDYLAKPFGVRELLARIKALLRRHGAEDSMNDGCTVGGITIDESTHSASYQGTSIVLTPREFELLATLVKQAGRVLSREELLKRAWDWEYIVETKTVDTHIKRLRDKLKDAGADPQLVETIRGYGYRFKGRA